MGIKNLNSYLTKKCSTHSIFKTSIQSISGKTIAIDISIYLYKYLNQNSLLENIYVMIHIFKANNINPIFVFDGKSPIEKWDTLKERYQNRKAAEETYLKLKAELEAIEINDSIKKEKMKELNYIKQKTTKITKTHIANVKELIYAFGCIWIDAVGEADQLCAFLVNGGHAYGCLSDDMDMLLYGCPIIIRCFNLYDSTITIYNTENILKDLNMDLTHLRKIIILTGTDYNKNIHNISIDLYESIDFYRKFAEQSEETDFYGWIQKYFPDHIKNIDRLDFVYKLFMLSDFHFEYLPNNTKSIDYKKIQDLLEPEGFIFI
jgi:flap endonuclease-1